MFTILYANLINFVLFLYNSSFCTVAVDGLKHIIFPLGCFAKHFTIWSLYKLTNINLMFCYKSSPNYQPLVVAMRHCVTHQINNTL